MPLPPAARNSGGASVPHCGDPRQNSRRSAREARFGRRPVTHPLDKAKPRRPRCARSLTSDVYLPAATRLSSCAEPGNRLPPSGARQRAAPPGAYSNPANRESGFLPSAFPAGFRPPCRVAILVAAPCLLITRVSLLFPWAAVVVIADRLSETGPVIPDEFESAHTISALPKIEMWHEQAGRAAVNRLERLAVELVNDPRFSAADVSERQIRRVAAVAKGDEITDGLLGVEV